MIAAHIEPGRGFGPEAVSFAQLLTFSGRKSGSSVEGPGFLLAALPEQTHRLAWRPGQSSSGLRALFNGQLHNRAEMAQRLGLPPGAEAQDCYAAAVERWDAAADEHLIGHYCAITHRPGTAHLRLARSPFWAPPLHFRASTEWITASSLQSSLFWRDKAARVVDKARIGHAMALDGIDPLRGWFEGCGRVPLGAVVELEPEGARVSWRYDLFTRPRVRFASDQEYVDRAVELLDEAVAKALEGARQPGSLVTGGLDSAQVAVSALCQLPPGQVLHGFTYGPEAGWDGEIFRGSYLNEFAAVARLAEKWPSLKPHKLTSPGQDFRFGQRDLIQAMECAPPSLALSWRYHDVFSAARAAGCDLILSGDFGNETISANGSWGRVEYFLTGRWIQLWRALRHMPFDDRPIWRRFLSATVMPLLPQRLRAAVFRVRKITPPQSDLGFSRGWSEQHGIVPPGVGAWQSGKALWKALMAEEGQDIAEFIQGFGRLYGIAYRDPTAYRPLVEFCFGLPTDQFMRDGIDRWLARRMAAGRLPDEQRFNRYHGVHDADWHVRMGRAREELIEELDRMADDPDIAEMLDIPALQKRLREFPAESTLDADLWHAYIVTIPLAISAGRFVAYAKGRNDI